MSIFQRLRATLVAEPNWLENHLFLANVTMPSRFPFANAHHGKATDLSVLSLAFKPHFPVGAGPWHERGLRAHGFFDLRGIG